jgi:hypothetical protein
MAAVVVVNILLTLATYNLLIIDLYLVNTYTDTGIVRYTQNCNVELTMTDGDDTLYSYILYYIAAAENSIILLHTVSGQSGGTRGDGGNSFTPYRFFLVFDSIQLHSFYVLGNCCRRVGLSNKPDGTRVHAVLTLMLSKYFSVMSD